jgi:hypothetical protein
VISEEQARAGIATARAFVEEISRIIADVPKE